jgi:hypothetical protein
MIVALDECADLSPGVPVFYYPPGAEMSGAIGLQLKVATTSSTFFARFESGDFHGLPPSTHLIGSRWFLAIVHGNAFLVDSADPSAYHLVSSDAITNVVGRSQSHSHVFLLASDFNVIGITNDGHFWSTSRISSDGITVLSQEDDHVTLEVINPSSGVEEVVKIDTNQGNRI